MKRKRITATNLKAGRARIGHADRYEHLMTRENAGLFDETSFNKIEVRGPGA